MKHVADVQAVKLKVYGNIKDVLTEAMRTREALQSCLDLPAGQTQCSLFAVLLSFKINLTFIKPELWHTFCQNILQDVVFFFFRNG